MTENDKTYDSIILGSDIDSMISALTLASVHGERVCILEESDELGGILASKEFHPGFKTDGSTANISNINFDVLKKSNLDRYDLKFKKIKPSYKSEKLSSFMEVYAPVLRSLIENTPESTDIASFENIFSTLKAGIKLRMLGKKPMFELLRALPMSLEDFLNENVEETDLKSALAVNSLNTSFFGPRAPLTNLNFLLTECFMGTQIEGGMNALIQALTNALNANGVLISTNSMLSSVNPIDGNWAVQRSNGDSFKSVKLFSGIHPKRLFLDLLPKGHLSSCFEQKIRNYRTRGINTVIHFALNSLPDSLKKNFDNKNTFGTISHGMTSLEKAFDSVKYGEMPTNPFIQFRILTNANSSSVKNENAVVTAVVGGTPYSLKMGWSSESDNTLKDKVISLFESEYEGFKEKICAIKILNPVTLENEYGLTGGSITMGEIAPDQIITRPSIDSMGYKTPVENLWLTGAASARGPLSPGLSGYLSAQAASK